jgi:hypothetical protein
MEEYKESVLGNEALTYLNERLGCVRTLTELVRSRIRLETGRIRTYMPASMTAESLRSFESGSGGVADSQGTEWYASAGTAFLHETCDGALVLMYHGAEASDPWIAKAKDSLSGYLAAHGNELFQIVQDRHASEDAVSMAIRQAFDPWISLGIMTRFPAPIPQELSFADLTSLVDGIEKLAVTAYDWEGWLIWDRGR